MKHVLNYVSLLAALIFSGNSFADDVPAVNSVATQTKPVAAQLDKPVWASLYEPNYVLPFYYTQSPWDKVYLNNTPDQQRIKKLETNFQISFKVPFWHIAENTQLYGAYTQAAFWQSFTNSPFFRETNYEPVLFVQQRLDWAMGQNWKMKFLNAGISHQSNGRGGELERSWNRVYAEGIFANTDWMVSLKPWWILRDASIKNHNPDIGHFMGYGRELIAYKYKNQEFALQARNVLESGFKRGSLQATWSFPLTPHVKGFVKWFNGYGQSLVEYNHYTNSAGIGLSLNDWI